MDLYLCLFITLVKSLLVIIFVIATTARYLHAWKAPVVFRLSLERQRLACVSPSRPSRQAVFAHYLRPLSTASPWHSRIAVAT